MTCHRLSALFAPATNVRMRRGSSWTGAFRPAVLVGAFQPGAARYPHPDDDLQPQTPMIRTVPTSVKLTGLQDRVLPVERWRGRERSRSQRSCPYQDRYVATRSSDK